MDIYKINNVFSEEQVKTIKSLLRKDLIEKDENNQYINREDDPIGGYGVDTRLGRLQYKIDEKKSFQKIKDELENIIEQKYNIKLRCSGASCVEYSAEFGSPNLPVHWDHDELS